MIKDFLIPLFAVCMGEMGDKTQLVTMAFAARYNPKIVLWGIFCGTLLLDFISVCMGKAAVKFLGHTEYITIAAGIAFLVFALLSFKNEEEEENTEHKGRSPFMAVFLTFFLAEMGDKTMLTTIALATQYKWYMVWLGATFGMVIADGLAVFIGMKLGKMIPHKLVKIIAAVLFLVFGVYYIYIGIRGLV